MKRNPVAKVLFERKELREKNHSKLKKVYNRKRLKRPGRDVE